MEDRHQKPIREVLEELRSSENGLTEAQAQERLRKEGENRIIEGARKRIWQVFLAQFEDLLVLILIGAAVVSAATGDAESTAVILAVITLNAALGTIQHEKAQKSLDSLKKLTSPMARVLRDGRECEIDSSQVVPGDILFLDTGGLAAADGRVIESHHLMVNESSLTGESEAVEKSSADDRVFAGTLIVGGRGRIVVTATGMCTRIGEIALMMNETGERKTPLQVSLDQFGGRLAAGIMLICLLVFGLSLYRGMAPLDALVFAVALAVAAIPEALGSIVTIVQAMGTQRMAKECAVIKDLKAVESLGCVSVICSDKTGTLTQNRMSVEEVYVGNRRQEPGTLSLCDPVHRLFLYTAVLTNDAGNESGEPTETALIQMAGMCGVDSEVMRQHFPRLGELPFDSERKEMSTLHRIDGKLILMTKGAPDVLLAKCTDILTTEGRRPLHRVWRQNILEMLQEWSGMGLRVLAMAYKPAGEEISACTVEMEDGLIWLGMAAMMDPPRPESRASVMNAKRAGIRTVMITGDYAVTAQAIARRIGISGDRDRIVTGDKLDRMSREELLSQLEQISVYARVSPEHKIRIVDAWQQKGHIVAMTGDGVNDAPALKKADIGIAMGMTGTEVSRDAASMILMDDNFTTIIKAVVNGRNVYRNIRHAVEFLLSGNIAGILCVLITCLTDLPMPFAPVHLLFINLLTDSLPAIAIGMEPQEVGLLDQPPRDPKQGILTGNFMLAVALQGGLIAAGTMGAYHTGLQTGGAGVASTMAFATLTLARLFHGFNCRSERSIVQLGFGSNLWSVMAFETGVILLAAVLFVPPLQVIFAAADLNPAQIVTIIAMALLPTVVVQVGKIVLR
ncbi:MAG: cation-translocating P-type ATPase [Clostridiales bacterium]|nr:cation-translocating P-type ATPase [Clostridiales bacterium]